MIKSNTTNPKQSAVEPIDCDQVFERLTAGPFPQDNLHDEHVQLHLRCCHDCRSFAEAMRPAVGLIHESMAEQARIDLPVFTGTLPADDRILLAVRESIFKSNEAEQIQPDTNPDLLNVATKHSKRDGLASYMIAAALLVLFAFVAGLSTFPLLNQSEEQVAKSATVTDHQNLAVSFHSPDQIVDSQQFNQWLANIDCGKALEQSQKIFALHDQVAGSMLDGVCCSECHTSGGNSQSTLEAGQIAALVQACQSCHDVTD